MVKYREKRSLTIPHKHRLKQNSIFLDTNAILNDLKDNNNNNNNNNTKKKKKKMLMTCKTHTSYPMVKPYSICK